MFVTVRYFYYISDNYQVILYSYEIKKLKNAVNADVADDIGELLKLSYEEGARDQRRDDIEFISGYFTPLMD